MKLPIFCPSCESSLSVSQMKCNECATEVSGNYQLPLYLQLSPKEQDFILNFFLSGGSIKEMARKNDISYPTMRNKIDDLMNKINELKNQ
ncbi:MAG: hypothetical protein CSA38_04235 [Flavobacteriales bacterium]|nr:MAG: hypothetical protein CSA38_04235 [Flavobacteriales bacterium]